MANSKKLFSYRKHWASRLGPAPYLPTSRQEMQALNWDACDVVLITGDAYVDHPSFGTALIGRLLEAQGFRVGVIAQPSWHSADDFAALGKPTLFFGVTAGNLDSMVNHLTAERRVRSDDAYSPGGQAGLRPDRATIVYANRCRQAYAEVPIVLGGIEASLRRVAHYDYWSEKVRRSILLDAKADLLLYGNAERAIVELAHALAAKRSIASLQSIRGTAVVLKQPPTEFCEIDLSRPQNRNRFVGANGEDCFVRLPSHAEVAKDKTLYAHASRLLHLESNPHNARPLVQRHGDRELWLNPPPLPLSSPELDRIYELPYQRQPHPKYGGEKIPAYEMIRFSVCIMRGCFGGCTFCSLTAHEGRIIQNRSPQSILKELAAIRDQVPGFTGQITDLGGPSANMYHMGCSDPKAQQSCRRLSCVSPRVCGRLNTAHKELIKLYRQARAVQGVKKITIGSGIRYDLAVRSPEYIQELVQHHVGGYLKIAPEHIAQNPLRLMQKPGPQTYQRFAELFARYSQQVGKEQYLIPYFIAAHPGTSLEDMLELALWLKKHGFRPQQVQTFLPTPMTLATTMYHSGKNPLSPLTPGDPVEIPSGGRTRKIHKAFLRYHDPELWPLLRQTLEKMGRQDLIGNKKHQLIPAVHPRERRGGTWEQAQGRVREDRQADSRRGERGHRRGQSRARPNKRRR